MTRHARNLGEGGVVIGTARWIKSAARFFFGGVAAVRR
jgi:hypothetical protein